jgi:hypothetical protein
MIAYYINIIRLSLFIMAEDNKKDKAKDEDEIALDEKIDRKDNRFASGKNISEQPEEEEIQEHPEH